MTQQDRHVWAMIAAVALAGLLFVPFSEQALNVTYDHTLRTVALGGTALGIVSGVLGSFAVLRRESLIGDALAHAALPGVCAAFLLAGRELSALLIGAGVASWLGVYFIHVLMSRTRLKQDVAMGVVLAAWFAAGIALLTYIQARPDASQAGLSSFIFGQAAAMVERDVQLLSLVGLAAFGALLLFWKEFKLITFDAGFAAANGFPVALLSLILSTLIVVAIVLGLQLAGVILMVGLLIAPGVAARQWTHQLGQMVALAGVFGGFAGGMGAILSAVDRKLPTGPMIVVVAALLVFVSLAFAPQRGLLWATLRQRADRRRYAARHVLADLYKYASDHGGASSRVPDAFLRGVRGGEAVIGLNKLQRDGLIQASGEHWTLTREGITAAEQANHAAQGGDDGRA
jgi:manganese/zinc/iron transport system permease protein